MVHDELSARSHDLCGVFVARSSVHGRGLFAADAFAADEWICTTPVLVIPPDGPAATETTVDRYVFEWGEGAYALALGPLSLVNHSAAPNAYTVVDENAETIELYALVAIAPHDELLIDYTAGAPDAEALFDPEEPHHASRD